MYVVLFRDSLSYILDTKILDIYLYLFRIFLSVSYCFIYFLIIIEIVHKFKEFLKQRII